MSATQTVTPGSHLTLHYRIALAEAPHTEVLSTFGGHPATLVLGSGELSPKLESCLVGVVCGTRQVFTLAADQSFGERREDFVQSVPLGTFPPTMNVQVGQVIEFSSPEGASYSGLVQQIEGGAARVDFNHPLAGRSIRFEVEVLAVL